MLICPTEDLEWTSVGTSQRASVAIPTNINMGCLMEIPGHIRLWRPMGPRRNELLGLHGFDFETKDDGSMGVGAEKKSPGSRSVLP